MKLRSTILLVHLLSATVGFGQERLYSNTFPLSDVQLLDGPFKQARDLNIETLLKYEVNRLVAPYLKEAGLPPKDSSFTNWQGLDGHVGGHYLSALAMNYAATGNVECGKRLGYILSELKACQSANTKNHPAWGSGYVGAVPNSAVIWTGVKEGKFDAYRSAWVPWYNLHKTFAGLRDAWLYAGKQDGKDMFLKFCDWAISITNGLSGEQMQRMLDTEHGGMNEIFADAFQMTGEKKYLVAAKKFSHAILLNAMAQERDNLDNKHANTQVPKAIGFYRVGETSKDAKYLKAGRFFWETVTSNRSLAFGGNSRREFFPSASACIEFVDDVEGPETCNSYNMLKLSEDLFRTDLSAKYVDYFERTLFNHILSSQHPQHGGYVYFTPARPRHYRVYSSPNAAMWCCVGSGMENHSKYNQFIYSHTSGSLYVNLFVASELSWNDKSIKIKQETNFPFAEKTRLIVTEGNSRFKLMIRHPSWVQKGAAKIVINGKPFTYKVLSSSYIAIDRAWKTSDVVEVMLPMQNRVEQLPNVPEYVAIMRGPILLAAKTGNENLNGLVADDGRWAHIAHGRKLPLDRAPIIIEEDKRALASKLQPLAGKPMHYKTDSLRMSNAGELELQPFFTIHDSRYSMYWLALSNAEYKAYIDSIKREEKMKFERQERTLDFVAPGEQQPEADHQMQATKSRTGNFMNEFWRDANNEGYFSYDMNTNRELNLSLFVRYWGYEEGNRSFDIYIDEQKLISENNTGRWKTRGFKNVEYKIPAEMLSGRKSVRVKFQAQAGTSTSAVYFLRILRNK